MTKLRALMTPEEADRARAQRRAAYQRKRDQELAYAAAYRDANRDLVRERDRNPTEARREYLRGYTQRNRDRINARRAKWREENREKASAANAAYLQKNLDRHRVNQQNRRARKIQNGGRLSIDIVQRLFALQRGKCACCSQPLGDSYDLDHIVPLALGGANSDENVQLLTAICNRQKGASDPIAFMQRRGRLL